MLSKETASKEELQIQEEDANIQFIVLLQLIIERIEFLESRKYIFGTIKNFLLNGKNKFENHLSNIFKRESFLGKIEEEASLKAASAVMIMQQRVEKALANEYMITVDERRERAKKILSTYLIAPMVEKALKEMEGQNLFNF